MLDRERPISFTNRALYLIGELPNPPQLEDLNKPGKAYNTLLKFIWVCLADKDHPFKSPQDLADYITPDKAQEAAEKLAQAMGGELDQKKRTESTGEVPGASPESNSD